MGGTQEGAALPPAPSTDSSDGDAHPGRAPTALSTTSATGGLPGVGGPDGFGGFGKTFLTEPVGRGQANKPDDVHRASSFLADNGILPSPTRDADEGFLRGIEKGQERLNDLAGGGLRVDGIAKPWGPTEILSQRAVTSGKLKAFQPAPAFATRPGPVVQPAASKGKPIGPVGRQANQPRTPAHILQTLLASENPTGPARSAQPKLPSPHLSIRADQTANRPGPLLPPPHGMPAAPQTGKGTSTRPARLKPASVVEALTEIRKLLMRQQVEKTFEIGPDGKPTGRVASDKREDLVGFGKQFGDTVINLIDGLLAIATRGGAPSALTPTLDPKSRVDSL